MTTPLRSVLALTALLTAARALAQTPAAPKPAEWTRGATCYEIFVRSFYDSDGDGIGDFRGLTEKLDYINDGRAETQRDLGARCLWLMPVMASPSYHGYDATDYYRINPQYGTNADFRAFVAEAHRRGVKVLVDMVLNHASNEHPFFKSALYDTASPYRAWFRWSKSDPGTKGPWGQQVWHKSPVRDEWYYGIFWHGMPDYDYDHAPVREEAKRIAAFWLDSMGVDGFRLDAIPYLVEQDGKLSGTPGTHALLREWSAHVRRTKPDAWTVGEVWDSVGAMLPYYPDQLDAHFSFESANAILDAVRKGQSAGLLASFMRLQAAQPQGRWSPFLRNHDQTRTMTELKGDWAKAKQAATLLLTLPGVPFVYYGEEIGMTGDKPDPRLRTPMHWTAGPAAGFTRGVPWEPLQPDSATTTVAAQEGDPSSLLDIHRRLIHLRGANDALAGGELVALTTSNPGVAAYVRRQGDQVVAVVANLTTGPIADVSISSEGRVMRAGSHRPRDLMAVEGSRVDAAALRVGADGRIRAWVPMRSLGAHETIVLELAPAAR